MRLHHLEITAFGGLGQSWQEGSDSRGMAWEIGSRLGLTWAPVQILGGRPLIGVAVLAALSRWTNPATLNGVDYDLTLQASGVTPAGVIGWRF